MTTLSDSVKPSTNPNCFNNLKGLLELVGIYSTDVSILNANFRKWALKYHPDKGGEKDFFSLVTECVKGATEYLEKHQQRGVSEEGFEEALFAALKEHDRVRYMDDLGNPVYGVILQLHPPWSPEKTHIVICKTDPQWSPEPQTRKMYVLRESIHDLLRKKPDEHAGVAVAKATAASAFASGHFENVSWRDLRAGDKIRVTYVNVKTPGSAITAYGIFRSAPTYSDVVEFVKTDETFTNLSKSFTSVPLTGSMCRFQRFTAAKSVVASQAPFGFTNHSSWGAGACSSAASAKATGTPNAATPTAAAASAAVSTKKRKVL